MKCHTFAEALHFYKHLDFRVSSENVKLLRDILELCTKLGKAQIRIANSIIITTKYIYIR